MNTEFKTCDQYYPLAANKYGVVKNMETGKIRKQTLSSSGYYTVSTRQHGNILVHRLVATIWINNPDQLPCVNHKDCNKFNNHVDNLEWCTHKENTIHARDNGRLSLNCKYGEDSNLSEYSDELIHLICKDLQSGMRNIDVAKTYNIPPTYIKQLKAKKSRRCITEQYTFPEFKRQLLSESTVVWICKMIVEGKGNTEILKLCRNNSVKISDIKNIRYKRCYSNISDEYF